MKFSGALWKSGLLATGIFAAVLGAEMLLIDSAVIMPLDGRGGPHTFVAPDWAPWTLLSVGTMTILHFFQFPGRSAGMHRPGA